MRNLFSLLERFSKSLNKDTFTKETVAKVILDKTRVNLPLENISLKDGVLELNTGATAKSEINLKEEFIKTELKEALGVSISRILYK